MERYLNVKDASFDLSDIKNEKTQYLDKTSGKSHPNSPFEPREISARSTHIKSNSKYGHLDFDEIMKSSASEAVKNKYRESMATGRLSNFPKQHNLASSRSSISSNNGRTTSTTNRKDFWDEAEPSFSSFTGKNLTYSNEEFIPAENMAAQLDEDEKMQEMEYAVIPKVTKVAEETINWTNILQRQPEMSFGQYCQDRVKQVNIRDIYNAKSPPKRQDRTPLVEISSNNDSELCVDEKDIFKTKNVEKLIKKGIDPAETDKMLFRKNAEKQIRGISKEISNAFSSNNSLFSNSISKMMEDLDVDRILELAEKERSKMKAQKKNNDTITNDDIPVQDENRDDLQRHRNELQIPNRGLKRRPSLTPSNDTPKSALDKCLRSRSPSNQKEIEMAAARLKPRIVNEDVFKKPLPYDSTVLKSCLKSPSRTFTDSNSDSQQSSVREYVSAMQSLSLRSQEEKLSLPNYSLQRPATSPTSSVRSMNSKWSPECGLRRSASQLSNESEFSDDFLPIKIKNRDNNKISFPSVKIDKSVTKSISIQNGSNKKLPLRVRVIGAGFSVSPQEEFRMVPMEARTFNVKFSPSIVGPACGCLIFEQITNRQCSKTIPLYAFGGHCNIIIENIQKGPFGPPFITMGTVKDLTGSIEHRIKLVNKGTLAAFVTLAFERTKLSDFVLSNSITLDPMQLRVEAGKSADVKIRFKATKSEIRKIISLNKDVTIIGEICAICCDEPTIWRIIKNKHLVEPKLLEYLPKSLPNDAEMQHKLQKFNENLSRDKITTIMQEIRTHEIALTINRNLDDTVMLSTEMSLADDTHMSFETFVTNLPNPMDTLYTMDGDDEDSAAEYLESKFFRIFPSEIVFKRSTDNHETVKPIKIESLCNEYLYIEAVPSNPRLLSATRPCGKLNARGTCEIKVSGTQRAFESMNAVNTFVVLIIRDARIEIPVKIVD